jgi:hypothetical protein
VSVSPAPACGHQSKAVQLLRPDACSGLSDQLHGCVMSKGMNQKKDAKKKPAKTMKEKRADKQAKRQSRG